MSSLRPRACNAALALTLLGAVGPAWAEYAAYQGEVRLASGHDSCSRVAGGTSFNITVNGRDDAPIEPIDGYLSGDQIVPAHLHGTDIGRLAVSFPGEATPTHTLKLRRTGPGAFEGQLPVKTLLQLFTGCDFASAQIRFSLTATRAQSDYEQAAKLFAMDARSVQTYAQGLRGSVRQGLAVLGAALEVKRKIYGATHPQLLPYEFFLAALEEAAGDFPAQVPLYRAALEACASAYTADSVCTALALTNLSNALIENGAFTEAESSARAAIALCDKLFGVGDPLSGIALDALGAVLLETGRYGEADATLTRALEYNRTVYGADSARVGLTLTNRSVLARYTGEYREAESSMREALAIDTRALGPDSPLAILNTIDLGQILRVAGRPTEAEPLCRRALEAAQRVLGPERPDHPSLGLALVCVAELLRESGRYAQAEPLYRQALGNYVKYLGPEHPSVAVVDWMLAKQLRATGHDAEALTLLDGAYRIAETSGNAMLRWRIAAELMLLYGSDGQRKPAAAIFFGKQAVNDLQRLRGALNASAHAQQAFVAAAEVHSVYTSLADLLVADGRLAEAQQVLAMLKEHELYDFIRDSAESDPRRTVVTLSAPEKQLEDLSSHEVAEGQEYGDLQAKFRRDHALGSADRARLEALRKSMDASHAAFEARVTEVTRGASDPEAQRRRHEQIADFGRAFQETLKALGHDAVLAQYFILEDKVEILFTTPGAAVARESRIKRADLDEEIRKFRQALASPAVDPLPQAQQLYRVLIGPIAADLRESGARTLMLSLDDTLRYVPFAALHDGSHYLVEGLSVAIATEAVRDKLSRQPLAAWSVWGLGVTKAHAGAAPLPWAGVELNDIAGPKGVLGGKVLLDAAFNERSLRDGLDQAYPIIHIASHFRFAPGSMDDSVLLMGDGSLLTLAQIRDRLSFNGVDLLTLSACETALGDSSGPAHHGIEVEGLGAIAQQAGAGAVLATLWSVADSSTAVLMRALYAAHRDQHLTKAEALRYAQLGLLSGTVKADSSSSGARGLARMNTTAEGGSYRPDPNAPFAHPYFWAPFILMGNWL